MKRMRTLGIAAVSAALLALTLGSTTTTAEASTAKDRKVPTFKEFEKSTFQDKTGVYVVNGDEPVLDKKALKAYYRSMVGFEQELIVNTVGGVDDAWTNNGQNLLTYCVSTKFSRDYAAVVNAMAAGAAQWEAAANVDFTYVPAQDANCTTRNNSVVFSVEPTRTQQYIARAFFPSYPKSARNVLVNARSLQTSGSWTPSNILAHELGHILGFRHEHTRPEAGTCFEDNNWRALTPYDRASIMHYPQCNGSSSDLSMTDQDRAGLRALYGS